MQNLTTADLRILAPRLTAIYARRHAPGRPLNHWWRELGMTEQLLPEKEPAHHDDPLHVRDDYALAARHHDDLRWRTSNGGCCHQGECPTVSGT